MVPRTLIQEPVTAIDRNAAIPTFVYYCQMLPFNYILFIAIISFFLWFELYIPLHIL